MKEGVNEVHVAPWSPKASKKFMETKDTVRRLSASCWTSGLQIFFFSSFCFCPGHKNNTEEKTYPAMDSPVYGEADDINFISVEEWIHTLWLFIYV